VFSHLGVIDRDGRQVGALLGGQQGATGAVTSHFDDVPLENPLEEELNGFAPSRLRSGPLLT
jgi:hypothetical protein